MPVPSTGSSPSYAPVPRSIAARPRPGNREGGPDRHRNALGVRSSDARYDLTAGFPLLTTKKLHTRSIFHELLWFLAGDTNLRYLNENGVRIWDEWADETGDLGPIYGYQWRSWPTPDGGQIDQTDAGDRAAAADPSSRRHIVSAWNAADIDRMKLPPCHALFQFYVAEGRLSCQLYQRSADVFLGVPFNIASYALLTHMVAQVCDLEADEFVHHPRRRPSLLNHLEQAREQLTREPRARPRLVLNPAVRSLFDFRYEDITIEAYEPEPHIRAPIAV